MNRSLLIVLFFIVFDIRYCYSQQVTRDEAIAVAKTELLYTKGVTKTSWSENFGTTPHRGTLLFSLTKSFKKIAHVKNFSVF